MNPDLYEENNPSDIDLSAVFEQIRIHWPDIQLEDIHFHYHGTYNVFIIKNQYILRIPDIVFRNNRGLQLLSEEKEKLTFFQQHLPQNLSIEIPNPVFLNLNSKIPFYYYKIIPGCSLNRIYDQLSLVERQKIAFEIASFLKFLHDPQLCIRFQDQFPQYSDFTPQKYYQKWKSYHQKVQQLIYPSLSPEEQRWITTLFRSFLDHPEYCEFSPCVVHGDFDTSNILVGGSPIHTTGIIDFEECQIGDPANDLLFYLEGSTFHNIIYHHQLRDSDQYITNRMKFLYCRTCLAYLEFGLDQHRDSMIIAGKVKLKKLMSQFPDSDLISYEEFARS